MRSFVLPVVVVAVVAGCGYSPPAAPPARPRASAHSAPSSTSSTSSTTTTTTTTTPVLPAAVPAPVTTGNARLDALLPTLPSVLWEGGAHVHFGYNPIDCCHAGGYNPEPNDVWVSERALRSDAALTYVTVHELAHSVHLRSGRAAALTAAVAGAPAVRPGSPWDDSEKVADCVAWVLYPAQTAASGLTYWNCPDPWRTQVRTALQG